MPVDKNLKDDWLQRLNSLSCLELTNICEGHTRPKIGPGQARCPYRTLHFRNEFCALVDRHREALERLFMETFPVDPERNQICCGTSDSLLTLRSPHDRQTDAPEADMERWFEQTIAAVEHFDCRCREILSLREENGQGGAHESGRRFRIGKMSLAGTLRPRYSRWRLACQHVAPQYATKFLSASQTAS